MARIVFDMDGTITEGRFLEPPRTPEMYAALKPYDQDTAAIWNKLIDIHELYIITARSDYRADMDITDWLYEYGIIRPTAIITNPIIGRKNPENAIWKRNLIELIDPALVFDDSPYVWYKCQTWCPTMLMDNLHWPENQVLVTDTVNQRVKSWKEIGAIVESYNDRKSHELETGV